MSEPTNEAGATSNEYPAALDELDGDELHAEEFMGDFISPDEDPNLLEHLDG